MEFIRKTLKLIITVIAKFMEVIFPQPLLVQIIQYMVSILPFPVELRINAIPVILPEVNLP